MDKIEELIDHFAGAVEAYAIDDYWVLRENRKEARVALRAEFDAQASRIAELEKEVHDVSVYLNKNHAPVVDWNLKPGYAAVELLKKFYSEKVELEAENAALKDAQRWIPVGERLPEDRVNVLVCEDDGCVGEANHIKNIPQWSIISYGVFYHGDQYKNVTHWQPLPQPPEAE